MPDDSTIPHYERRAAAYTDALLSHDTGECRDAFLHALPRSGPCDILDLGCGPGRDLTAFAALGHRAVGLEGSPTLAATARGHSGCTVWPGDLLALTLPQAAFDGIFANAVLFHVPVDCLPALLSTLAGALRRGGVLFACDPTGSNAEGWVDDRFVAFRHPLTWRRLMRAAGFAPIRDWRRPPDAPRHRQNWLASLWRIEHAAEAF